MCAEFLYYFNIFMSMLYYPIQYLDFLERLLLGHRDLYTDSLFPCSIYFLCTSEVHFPQTSSNVSIGFHLQEGLEMSTTIVVPQFKHCAPILYGTDNDQVTSVFCAQFYFI